MNAGAPAPRTGPRSKRMDRRERIGLGVLVGLLAFLFVMLVWTLWGSWKPTHDFSESVFVKQRIVNLKK